MSECWKWVRCAVVLAACAGGCGGGESASPDGAAVADALGGDAPDGVSADSGGGDTTAPDSDAAPDPGDAVPAAGAAPAAAGSLAGVFGPVDDTAGKAIAALMTTFFYVPESAAEADAIEAAARAAEAALAADPAGFAARILPACQSADSENTPLLFACMQLLSHFETDATLAFLQATAAQAIPDLAERFNGDLPDNPPLSGAELAAVEAADALGARARAGSSAAADALVVVCAVGAPAVIPRALVALYSALPRHVVKAKVRPVLPQELHYLLYAVH